MHTHIRTYAAATYTIRTYVHIRYAPALSSNSLIIYYVYIYYVMHTLRTHICVARRTHNAMQHATQ